MDGRIRKLPIFNVRFRIGRRTETRVGKTTICRELKIYTQRTFLVYSFRSLGWAAFGSLTPGIAIYLIGLTGYRISIQFGILATVVGLYVTAKVAIFLSRRQHTVTTLAMHRVSKELETHINTIRSQFPGSTHIYREDAIILMESASVGGMPDIDGRSGGRARRYKAVYKSILAILNYYEFLAIGIKKTDLDYKVMHDFYASMVCTFCDQVHGVIKLRQAKNSEDFINLVDLYLAWKPANTFPNLSLDAKEVPPPKLRSLTQLSTQGRFRRRTGNAVKIPRHDRSGVDGNAEVHGGGQKR